MSRTPFAYASSHRIEESVVVAADGTRRRVLLKDLEPDESSVARPAWLTDPRREVAAYRLLADADLGTPACLGVVAGHLVLEKVDGIPLWQCGEAAPWLASARWLGAFHSRFAHTAPVDTHLLRYDARYFRIWPERARSRHPEVAPLLNLYDRAVEILAVQPTTLVHGEFYPSNVVVSAGRVAPVDWEMAGMGPGVLDLAALITGWSEPERTAMVTAYGDVSSEALAAAQMHLALQWLGWADSWTPPADHARDWFVEFQTAFERLEL